MLDETKIIEITGIKFYVPNPNDSLYASIIKNKRIWVEDRAQYALNFISSDSIIVDVGAHIGTYTLQLASKVKKVIAVEPIERNANLLQANMMLNGLVNCKIVRKALSDKVGEKLIIDPERERLSQNSAATFLIPSQEGTITTTTLDDLLVEEIDPVSFIKISVQEMELEVLKGSIETLKKYKPLLYVALVYKGHINKRRFNNEQTKQFLKDLGYIESDVIKSMWTNINNPEHVKEV